MVKLSVCLKQWCIFGENAEETLVFAKAVFALESGLLEVSWKLYAVVQCIYPF